MISIIVAAAKNGVIGKQGGLPWYLPAELARFKQITMGHPIIMGRKTHQSIGRALPGRTNIVITRDNRYKPADGAIVAGSLEDAINMARTKEGNDEIFIIGGESAYKLAVPLADKLYLTQVSASIDGDRYFRYDPKEWKLVSAEKHIKDSKNPYDYEFRVLARR